MSNGQVAPFIDAGGEVGILATNDVAIISEMEKAMEFQRGGVEEITEEQYTDLKKNPPNLRLSKNSRPHVSDPNGRAVITQRPNGAAAPERAPVTKADDSEPLIVHESVVAKVGSMKNRRVVSPSDLFPLGSVGATVKQPAAKKQAAAA